MTAVIDKKHDIVKQLIKLKANVNLQDKSRKWSALHFAAQEYDDVSTKILIENGADVNAQDAHGSTVIARAVFSSHGRGSVIEILRDHGADANIKNNSGISALDLAKTISNYDVLQFFADK